MVKIDYPTYNFRIKEEAGKELVFDALRKLWVRLTPEEWVRQNFLQYLLQTKNYPAPLIAIEREIQLGELRKRFDVLVYDHQHQPWLMVECKAMDVELNEKTVEQILRYNISVPVPYLVITNGQYTFCFEKKAQGLMMMQELPMVSSDPIV